ncbi:hypothetical protein K7432_018561, partial [Basidiobolus ranarum]
MSGISYEADCMIVESILSELDITPNSGFSLTAPCCSTGARSMQDIDMIPKIKEDNSTNVEEEYTFVKVTLYRSHLTDDKTISLTCKKDTITDLNIFLGDKKFMGKRKFPKSVEKIKGLKNLDLIAENVIIPDDAFNNMKTLEWLQIADLNGDIHIKQGDLPNLKNLIISGKNWKWDIPKTLPNLTYLNLNGGNINTTIPENIWDLKYLQKL